MREQGRLRNPTPIQPPPRLETKGDKTAYFDAQGNEVTKDGIPISNIPHFKEPSLAPPTTSWFNPEKIERPSPPPGSGQNTWVWDNLANLAKINQAQWAKIGVLTKEGIEKFLFGATKKQLEQLQEQIAENASRRSGSIGWRNTKPFKYTPYRFKPFVSTRRVFKRRKWNRFTKKWEWINTLSY